MPTPFPDASGATASYDVLAVRYGVVESTRSQMYAAYDTYGDADGPVRLDYFFWVARNADRTVLVDTGFDPDVGRRRGRQVTCDVATALQRLAVDPASVTDVVLTHFHYDHIGNVRLFPHARILTTAREFRFWTEGYGRFPAAATATEPDEVEVLRRARAQGRLFLIGADSDRDCKVPGMAWIDLAGHTPGTLGVAVETEERRVVLASDAAHFYDEYERDRPFHLFTDIEGMYRGFERLRGFEADPDTVVVAGHDPQVLDRFAPVSSELGDLAVRLG